eukprot:2364984-Lingulodinium_polyedra.AAC.1
MSVPGQREQLAASQRCGGSMLCRRPLASSEPSVPSRMNSLARVASDASILAAAEDGLEFEGCYGR